jgi:hypothetical protein
MQRVDENAYSVFDEDFVCLKLGLASDAYQ